MMLPGVDDVLAAVVAALEGEIGPALSDDYAASTCRTAAQLLRSVRVRLQLEPGALREDNAELRALLSSAQESLPAEVREAVAAALAATTDVEHRAFGDVEEQARTLRAALVQALDSVPDVTSPLHAAVRVYLHHALERQTPWMVEAYTGPRR